MRIVLVTNYAPDRQESMLRFSATLAAELPMHGCDVEVLAPRAVFGGRGSPHSGAGKWLAYLDKYVLFPWTLARRVRRAGPDTLFHITDHSNAVYLRFIQHRPHLLTCNDLLAIRAARGEFPVIRIGRSGRVLQAAILRGVRRAAFATCISAATRRDVLRLAGLPQDRVTVTHMGFNHPYRRIEPATARTLVGSMLPEPQRAAVASGAQRFVFHVGGNQWYKNRLGVLAIYVQMLAQAEPGKKVPLLLLAGQKWSGEVAAKVASDPALRASVFALEDIANAQLEALYSAAECLLFPSLAEGFGWPIVEAQACGCRVVTTDAAPMTEVGGEGPLYLDPGEVQAEDADGAKRAAGKIRAMLAESDADSQRRIEQGAANIGRFSTGGMIEKYATLYRQIMNA
jgi:glycosyltransferase involved in cell wall biosynthesis